MQNHYLDLKMEYQQNYFLKSPNPSTIYGLLSLKPKDVSGRMPLDIRFVLDRSYSMTEKVSSKTKLQILKKAVARVIGKLEKGDRVSVISFCDSHKYEVKPTVIQSMSQKKKLQEKVMKIAAGGGTRMSKALTEAVKEPTLPDFVTRLIFFTDGMICCGNPEKDRQDCLQAAKKTSGSLPWIILGIGTEYDDEFLSQLAEINRGRYDHVSRISQADRIFSDDIETMGEIALTNLVINIEATQDFHLKQVNRVVPEIKPVHFQSLDYCAVDLGDLDRVRGQKILIQLEGVAPAEGQTQIAKIVMSYNIPLRKLLNITQQSEMEVTFASDPGAIQLQPALLKTIQLTGANQLYTLGMQAMKIGDQQTASRTLTSAASIYTKLGEQQTGQAIKTLTSSLGSGTLGARAENIKRTLSTQVKYTLNQEDI